LRQNRLKFIKNRGEQLTFRANDIRIPVVSQRARTYRLVIDNIADSVRATGARVPADRVHARSLRRTVVVPGALDLENRLGGTAGTATAADVTAGTHADHGAHWMRWQDSTLGRFRAWLYDRTRVLTLVAQAGERVGTVAILPALGPDLWSAVDVGVSGEARWASAYR